MRVFYTPILLLFFLLNACSSKEAKEPSESPNQFDSETLQRLAELQDQRMGKLLIPYLKAKSPEHRSFAAMAFASVQDTTVFPYLLQVLQTDEDGAVRKSAAYALGQIASPTALSGLILALNSELISENQVYILEAIGKCSDSLGLAFLVELEPKDSSLLIGQSKALFRAAMKHRLETPSKIFDKCLHILQQNAVNEANFYAIHTLLRSGPYLSSLDSNYRKHLTSAVYDKETRYVANMILGRLSPEQNSDLQDDWRNIELPYKKAEAMSSIDKLNLADIDLLKKLMFDQKEVILSSKAADVLFDRNKSVHLDQNLTTEIPSLINRALHSPDMGLQSAACIALADENWELISTYRDSMGVLKNLQSMLAMPRQLETYIDFEKLLAKLENKKYITPEPDLSHKIDWEFVKSIPQNQKVKITTNLGDIVLKTNVDQAPGSVSNFLRLVDDGFYNNKVYHRVVPDFVIQGGCPRGDGWGSLDWTQRSEFSNYLKYEAGTVGLASSGRDTEGVQFFITHIPTPHLDGRYTIIGKVVEGMDVVHRIQMGDQIISISRIP